MIESMACSTPVAAYPVTGPTDVIEQSVTGYMHNDLVVAINKCLELDRSQVHYNSLNWTWINCATQFVDSLKQK
jgi:glycosyltransferase involved in cell wall biosynthesis